MSDSDTLRRFLFEHTGVRGNLVRLDASWRAVLDAHPYPDAVRAPLGEALAAAALLAATIKFDGTLILQVQSEGPIRTLVAQATSTRTVRGVARWDGEVPQTGDLAARFGPGRLVLTIEGRGEPYQGIVPLEGENLRDALERYFRDSEQLPTRLWLAADGRTAAGLLLQRLPVGGGRPAPATPPPVAAGPAAPPPPEDPDETWHRIALLADTLTPPELLGLGAEVLLHRLFHEESVRLFDPEPVAFRCGCSRARVEDMVRALGEAEAQSVIAEQGAIEVTCELCNRRYRLDAVDTRQLFAERTRHAPPAAHQ